MELGPQSHSNRDGLSGANSIYIYMDPLATPLEHRNPLGAYRNHNGPKLSHPKPETYTGENSGVVGFLLSPGYSYLRKIRLVFQHIEDFYRIGFLGRFFCLGPECVILNPTKVSTEGRLHPAK